MSVVGKGTKLIFCEGEPDADKPSSLDKRLLSRLLHGKDPTAVIVPAGGKQQLRAFIRGRLNAVATSANYLAFRDRDFDSEPPAAVSLIQFRSGQPIYMSHRAAIENYLIDAALIHDYWQEQSRSGPEWKHGGPPTKSEIQTWMNDAAGSLTKYQAVRWALASLKPAERWPEVRTTWTEGSGRLPVSLDETECLDQARRLVNDFGVATANVSEAKLLESYRRFSIKFSDGDFVGNAEYLVWFHGKDLRKA